MRTGDWVIWNGRLTQIIVEIDDLTVVLTYEKDTVIVNKSLCSPAKTYSENTIKHDGVYFHL